jgi:hypothetical protein
MHKRQVLSTQIEYLVEWFEYHVKQRFPTFLVSRTTNFVKKYLRPSHSKHIRFHKIIIYNIYYIHIYIYI